MNYDLSTKDGMDNAVQWTQQLIDGIRDNGTWIVPRSASFVTIDKKAKTAHITSMFPDPSIGRVLRAMGWTVKDSTQGESK